MPRASLPLHSSLPLRFSLPLLFSLLHRSSLPIRSFETLVSMRMFNVVCGMCVSSKPHTKTERACELMALARSVFAYILCVLEERGGRGTTLATIIKWRLG